MAMGRLMATALLASLAWPSAGAQAAAPPDPRGILLEHVRALGGLERLRAERSLHIRAGIEMPATGLTGSLDEWQTAAGWLRRDEDYGATRQVVGWNGEILWTLDDNGKVQTLRDEEELQRRRIAARLSTREYLDPGSTFFRLTYRGTERITGALCHVVEIANSLNSDVRVLYLDTRTFLLAQETERRPGEERRTRYSDYRRVNGIRRPFRIEQTDIPKDETTVVRVQRVEANEPAPQSLFDPPAEVRDFRFAAGDRAEDVPFRLVDGHIYIPVTIKDATRLWILDCGTSANIIDREYAEELGLRSEGKIAGKGGTEKLEFSIVTLPAYGVAGIQFESQRIAALPLKDLFKRKAGMDVVGILGYDFMSRFVTRVDYSRERLSFYDPDTFVYRGPGKTLAAPLVDNQFTVRATVDGRHGGRFFLDNGSDRMEFHYPFALQNGFLDLPGVEIMGGGAGADARERSARLQTIEIGGLVIDRPLMSWPLEKPEESGSFSRTDLIGNLGNSLLGHFVVYLDYKHERIILEKGADFGREAAVDHSGLQLACSAGGDLTVSFVSPGTPAAEAGLHKGDIILEIDGVAPARFTALPAVRALLKQEAGTRVRLQISRGGTTRLLELTLRDLYLRPVEA